LTHKLKGIQGKGRGKIAWVNWDSSSESKKKE